MHVHSLDLDVLVRLWFRMLWQRYDLGGISVGRSLRCNLLDCYLDFTQLPQLPGSYDDYHEGLEEQILQRPLVPPPQPVTLADIDTLQPEHVALLGLGTLITYEESVPADTAWQNGFEWERKRIRKILDRFSHLIPEPHSDLTVFCPALLRRKTDLEYETFEREQANLEQHQHG